MKYLLISLMFIPSLCFAEKIVGYEYYIPPAQTQAISDSKVMSGSIEEKERWTKLTRTTISTTMNNYAKAGNVKKAIVKQIIDKRPNGITATFEIKEGDVPSDYNYSTKDENKKKVEAEYQKRKAAAESAEKEALAKEMGL